MSIPTPGRLLSKCLRSAVLSTSIALALSAGVYAASDDDEVQIVIKPKVSMDEVDLQALLSAHRGRHRSHISALKMRVLSVPASESAKVLEALGQRDDIEFAEPDYVAHAHATANDPLFTQGAEWHLNKILAPLAWDITKGSSGVVIAVVDSGVNASHPDLAGKVLAGYDFVSNDSDPSDDNGHGTAVAGTAAPASNNLVGVTGVAWINPILPVKVLDATGSGTYSAIANGIIYAADHNARVINLSVGGTSASSILQSAVDYAWSKGAVIVASAGNGGNTVPNYPAACNNVISVSATRSDDTLPLWSNFGSYVDLAAPGENIYSLYGTNGYASWSGTSFSSPVTAGVVALMASANPQLTNSTLVSLLLKNCDDLGTAGYDVYFGNGRLNAQRAVAAARNAIVADITPPTVSFTSPAAGATLSGTFTATLSGQDNIGVTRVEFYIGSTLVGQAAAASAAFSVNTLNYSAGTYTLQARAYDAAGKMGSSSISVNFQNAQKGIADTVAPVVKITSPVDGSTLSSRTMKVAVSATDNVAVKKLALYYDGVLVATSSSASNTFSWSSSKGGPGAHKLQAYAYDAAGNVGASALVTVYQ